MIDLHPIFDEFIKHCVSKYHINDESWYEEKQLSSSKRHCINPFLTSEADVEMKFGSFLQDHISSNNLCVHSQLSIYPESRKRTDLSIHDIEQAVPWHINASIIDSLRAAIEVKYANCIKPDFDFIMGGVKKDLKNLSTLKLHIDKYLLIIFEAKTNEISQRYIEETLKEAQDNKINILSNNPNLRHKVSIDSIKEMI
jgi:hypothetical protein